ncbi:MAG: hypothetical protein JXR37_30045 [Kiritimatiellae bacterium]|nr:hypothetical protein [Kiritimatiellia bacterium]
MPREPLPPQDLNRAGGLLYSLAKQGTHRRAIAELLTERGLGAEQIAALFKRYTRDERRAATHAITAGIALLVMSIGLTVVTLSGLINAKNVYVWPWALGVGVWMLASGLRRRAKLRRFNRT